MEKSPPERVVKADFIGHGSRGDDVWRDAESTKECSAGSEADVLEDCVFLYPWSVGPGYGGAL